MPQVLLLLLLLLLLRIIIIIIIIIIYIPTTTTVVIPIVAASGILLVDAWYIGKTQVSVVIMTIRPTALPTTYLLLSSHLFKTSCELDYLSYIQSVDK